MESKAKQSSVSISSISLRAITERVNLSTWRYRLFVFLIFIIQLLSFFYLLIVGSVHLLVSQKRQIDIVGIQHRQLSAVCYLLVGFLHLRGVITLIYQVCTHKNVPEPQISVNYNKKNLFIRL